MTLMMENETPKFYCGPRFSNVQVPTITTHLHQGQIASGRGSESTKKCGVAGVSSLQFLLVPHPR